MGNILPSKEELIRVQQAYLSDSTLKHVDAQILKTTERATYKRATITPQGMTLELDDNSAMIISQLEKMRAQYVKNYYYDIFK